MPALAPRLVRPLVVVALLAGAAGCGRGPREIRPFAWQGTVTDGGWVRVRNLNGPVTVLRSTNGRVEAYAEPRYSGRPQRVTFARVIDEQGITFCAVWNGRGECGNEKVRERRPFLERFARRKSVAVHWTIRVPDGIRVDVETVNGKVGVAEAGAELRVETVNGAIEAAARAGAPVKLETVNGSVTGRVGALAAGTGVSMESVNGSVTAEVAGDVNADVEMETVNGRVSTDFPITVQGEAGARSLRGRIGTGGATMRLETVNGSVRLARRA